MLYGLWLRLRHLAYNKGWKKSFKADVPTVCVGNITVGGTGKTPHVEMLLRQLRVSDRWGFKPLAVLSRGYKRKSRGFQIVQPDSSASFAGDEPLQIARKFPGVTVAVDKNRVEGCGKLSGADLIVLDDAFQYRRLQPSLSIVLVDYNRPVYEDRLLPWGRLRDLPSRLYSADVVIVTKCPPELDSWTRQEMRRKLNLKPEQKLFFTCIRYAAPEPVFPEADPRYTYSSKVVLVSGIANNAPLRSYLSDTYKIVRRLDYPDHHRFSKGDVRAMAAAVKETPTACVMTTEKDAQRLREAKAVPDSLKQRLFYLPIEAAFISEEDERAFVEILDKI
ncbi:MAG: tetraacyldisaccharide 4'-kinase [Bacteroidales bacterium]|nr:tetraacyldisaccharide 4'-kinase [Bacteroidales bacterium]